MSSPIYLTEDIATIYKEVHKLTPIPPKKIQSVIVEIH